MQHLTGNIAAPTCWTDCLKGDLRHWIEGHDPPLDWLRIHMKPMLIPNAFTYREKCRIGC